MAGVRIGAARVDVSPYDNYEYLTPTGMGREVDTKGVLDPICIEAMAIEASGELAIIFTSDLRIVEPDWMEGLRAKISENCGCKSEHILFSSVHNHCSSPAPRRDDDKCKAECEKAVQKILDGFVEAATTAKEKLADSEFAVSTTFATETLGQCRRVLMDNGTCINGWGSGPMLPPGRKFLGSAGKDSSRIDIFVARESGKTDPSVVLSAYGTHPHLYQLPYFSGEFPGAAKKEIESRLTNTLAMHSNTIGGDIDLHCVHPMCDGEEEKVQWFKDSAKELGRRFADSVIPALPAEGFVSDGEFKYACRQVDTAFVAILAINDLAFVSIPGELFSYFGDRLRENSPYKDHIILAYNGSTTGYVPEALNYEQGSYEVMRGPRSDPMGESRTPRATETLGCDIIDTACELMKELKG